MWPQIGDGLRMSSNSVIGNRNHMEDRFMVTYQKSANTLANFSFFGVFDGHGGSEAAVFACDNLSRNIVRQQLFKSDKDADILAAISLGFRETHQQMKTELDKWPKHVCGLPSTAGTTASVAFIRNKKIYCGHVGDSGIVLGYELPDKSGLWFAKCLTKDHKPEEEPELSRIKECGGKVVRKKGVPRVVCSLTEVPFLAIARSLGDMWSYNSALDRFIVSPDPDTSVLEIDSTFRCLILASDGLWNMLSAQEAVQVVQMAENNENVESAKLLVQTALECWARRNLRADNTTAVTVIFDWPQNIVAYDYFELSSSDNSSIIEYKTQNGRQSIRNVKKKRKRILKACDLHKHKKIKRVSAP